MANQKLKRYPAQDSPFFRLNSKKKLAALLQTSPRTLRSLARSDDLYREFSKRKANGKSRTISAPHENLKRIQRRIGSLLQRIELPNSVYSPVKGRSYVDNATIHLGSKSLCLFDISNYFPNCRKAKVIWYFRKKMQCSPDVTALLCDIVTHKGSLPQGSPCSPILAYLCYQDMWNELDDLADESGCTLSIYVDDFTISGEDIPTGLAWNVQCIVRRHGHISNPDKIRMRFLQPAEITGVVLRENRATVPNRQYKRIHALHQQRKAANSPQSTLLLEQELSGRESQIEHIRKVSVRSRH